MKTSQLFLSALFLLLGLAGSADNLPPTPGDAPKKATEFTYNL